LSGSYDIASPLPPATVYPDADVGTGSDVKRFVVIGPIQDLLVFDISYEKTGVELTEKSGPLSIVIIQISL
jgi:hypothetical protein